MELGFDINKVQTPYYIVDEKLLIKNLELLQRVEKEAGCHILLAQKAFSMFSLYPLVGRYISGTAGSGLYEAKLGHEEMGKENHVFSLLITKKSLTRFYRFVITLFSTLSHSGRSLRIRL